MDIREQFRQHLEADDILVAAGVYDGISARLVEQMGFETADISGAGVSNSRLGKPDVGYLDLSENVAHASNIVDAVDIPVQADADTGYGNAVNVHHTVKQFEKAGVCAVMLEDQEWPKRCGHMEGKSVISTEDMLAKIEAADDARTDPNFLIKARTDAAKTHGIEEAVHRLNAYADAGADFVFADALLSVDDIETVARNTTAPTVVNMGYGIRERPTTPLLSPQELEDLGVAAVTYPRLITGAAVMGMKNGLAALQESMETGEVVNRPELSVGFEEYTDLIGLPEVSALEQQFARD